jgi:hypothetical protein
MKPTREEVREAVFKALHKILEGNTGIALDEAIDPMSEFDLDSEDGLDFADVLADLLGMVIPPEVNPFKDDVMQKPRTLGEIIDLVLALAAAEAPNV